MLRQETKEDTYFDDLSESDKLLLTEWADGLTTYKIPKDMDERIRARLRMAAEADDLIGDDYIIVERPPQSNSIPSKTKIGTKKVRKIVILVATISLVLSLGLSAGMLDFRSFYVAKEKRLMTISGEKNVYGQQYTSDIRDQYDKLAIEIGNEFFIPMYVPDGYALESIKIGEKTEYTTLTFIKENDVFIIKQMPLYGYKNEIYNVLTDDNLVEVEKFAWGKNEAILYKSTLEKGNIVYSIISNYNNTNLRLFGNLSKEETIKTFKLLVKYVKQ